MAVARVHKSKDYTVMSNYHFREKEMSLKAKGLLSLMLSLPDNWDYSIAGLVTLSKDGKDSVMTALQEIEQFGYLKRTRINDEKGQFAGYDYDIYESPVAAIPNTENPDAGIPYAENPNTENPPQLNTYISSTKELNNKKLNNKEIYIVVLDYLNSKTGLKYRASSKETQKHINARVSEGYTVEDFKTVIDKQYDKWHGTEYEQYLRPSTLFGSKFEGYLNAPAFKQKRYGNTGVEIDQNAEDDLAEVF